MHDHKLVKDIIKAIQPISEITFSKVEGLLDYETHKKGDTFISLNRRNEKEYFVLSGICRSYLINPKGETVTISFFTDQSVLSPCTIRTTNGISNLYFQALTDVNLATINANEFLNLMIHHSDIRDFGNAVLRNELMLKVDKEIGLASLSAKDRLLKFRERYPLLENQIPHPDIASYLGITNISLSRLRGNLIR
jgi:CRP-like cAMP-binding protein